MLAIFATIWRPGFIATIVGFIVTIAGFTVTIAGFIVSVVTFPRFQLFNALDYGIFSVEKKN